MTRAKGWSPYKIYLCGEDPTFIKSTCPADHPPEPQGYVEWHDWAKTMGKTHKQRKCDLCGLYAIWEPKKPKPVSAEPGGR